MKNAFSDLQNGTAYRSDLLQCRKLNIPNLRIDLRFRHQAVWREAHGQNPCSCFKKSVADHNWFALPEGPISNARSPSSDISGLGWSAVETVDFNRG